MDEHDAHQLYDIEETQKQLRIGRTSVYGLIASGDLRAIKIGRRTLVPAREIAAYVDRALATSGGERSAS